MFHSIKRLLGILWFIVRDTHIHVSDLLLPDSIFRKRQFEDFFFFILLLFKHLLKIHKNIRHSFITSRIEIMFWLLNSHLKTANNRNHVPKVSHYPIYSTKRKQISLSLQKLTSIKGIIKNPRFMCEKLPAIHLYCPRSYVLCSFPCCFSSSGRCIIILQNHVCILEIILLYTHKFQQLK